jgi:hypothetical protein
LDLRTYTLSCLRERKEHRHCQIEEKNYSGINDARNLKTPNVAKG